MAVFQETELYRQTFLESLLKICSILSSGKRIREKPSPPLSLPAVGLCFGVS